MSTTIKGEFFFFSMLELLICCFVFRFGINDNFLVCSWEMSESAAQIDPLSVGHDGLSDFLRCSKWVSKQVSSSHFRKRSIDSKAPEKE